LRSEIFFTVRARLLSHRCPHPPPSWSSSVS